MLAGMIIGITIEGLCSVGLVVIGLLLWKKQKITLLHDYHYRHVRQEDIPAYTRRMGIGLIVMGVGIGITGILNLFGSSAWFWLPLTAGIIAGFVIMHLAQKQYNGSWMS